MSLVNPYNNMELKENNNTQTRQNLFCNIYIKHTQNIYMVCDGKKKLWSQSPSTKKGLIHINLLFMGLRTIIGLCTLQKYIIL